MNYNQLIVFGLTDDVAIVDARLSYKDYCYAMSDLQEVRSESEIINQIVSCYQISECTVFNIKMAFKELTK
jgi:hypothetical protein